VKASIDAIQIIAYYEGFSSTPYLCPAGVPTIGYGTTVYPENVVVTMNDDPITKREGALYLLEDVNIEYAPSVDELVTSDINQSQFDAMTSFTYNVGVGAFSESTLLKYNNTEEWQMAADEFLKWVYADGEVLQGLVNRRETERSLYLSESSL